MWPTAPRWSEWAPIAGICYLVVQMRDLVETAELQAFAKIVEARSVSRAAAELRVPRATLGRRLARLEERLGVRLLRRTTRSVALTDAGEALYRHARIVLDAIQHAEASVRQTDGAIRGDLRVSVPPMITHDFYAMVAEFVARHPEVRLQVDVSTRVVDLQAGDHDVAIRAGSEIQPGLIARTLARDPVVAVASPAYLAEHGTPRTRRDLANHRCVMGFARGEVPQTHWPTPRGSKIHVEGVFFSNDLFLCCEVALRGVGIALLPLVVVRQFLERGELVHVLRDVVGGQGRIAVVYPEREFLPAPVRAFVDAVAAWGPEALAQPLPECPEPRDGKRRPRKGKRRATRTRV